jgi:hypothetical protein
MGTEIETIIVVNRMYLVVFIVLLVRPLAAQVDVPTSIKIRFNEDYISATHLDWKQERDNEYTVSFFHQSHYKKATYAADGELISVETVLTSLAQVPDDVERVIRKQYKFYSIDKIWKSEKTGETIFNFLVRKDERMYELKLLASGKIRRKSKYEGAIVRS